MARGKGAPRAAGAATHVVWGLHTRGNRTQHEGLTGSVGPPARAARGLQLWMLAHVGHQGQLPRGWVGAAPGPEVLGWNPPFVTTPVHAAAIGFST